MSHHPYPKKGEKEPEEMELSLKGMFKVDKELADLPDEKQGIPTGVWVMGAPTFWNSKTPILGQGVIVGVIDTGIDDTHPDLHGKVRYRRDYVNDGARTVEFNLHGTHVAGTIAADGKIKGVAPKAILYDYRVLDKDGSGSFQAITQAITDAVKDGCNILNLSLGGPTDYPPMHKAIATAVESGVLVVVAAGNDGGSTPAPNISYPSYYPEVVGVGAMDFDPATGKVTKAYFTSLHKEVDCAADGFQVLSTIPGGKYAQLSGTSMASPHVAGFAALLLERYRIVEASPRTHPRPTSNLEPILYSLVKQNTVDVLEVGNDWASGAGFVTAYPALPVKRDGRWVIPGMEFGAP